MERAHKFAGYSHTFFLSFLLVFLWVVPVFCQGYTTDRTISDLESSAKYDYYVGQYYYGQGRFNDATYYFERSKDSMEKRASALTEDMETMEGIETPRAYRRAMRAGSALQSEYRVGVEDILYISVWQNEDLNEVLGVRPDGKISVPLIGDVFVAGLTIPEIDEEITNRLKEFIRFPEVSVSLRKLGGSKVIVLGQVRAPGVYMITGEKTILEVIAIAGGFTNDAVSNSIVLVRGGLEKPQARRLNLKKTLRGADFKDNIPLQSEDIIYVPKTFIADISYVLNQIIDPVSRGALAADIMQKWNR